LKELAMPTAAIPFDTARLDRLMDEAGLDVLLATSKHNVQYLLGGHRAFFFDYMDAMGLSRYLPVMVYPKGAPNKAAYFGHRLENFERENHPFWTPVQQCNSSGSVDTMQKAVDYIKKAGMPAKAVAAELAFMPIDAGSVLWRAFGEIKDALFVLERLRARKTPDELKKLRIASELVIDSMLAVIASHGPPLADIRAGGAERRARPVTVTGAPAASVTLAGSGSWHTVAGTGTGIRPGQGRSGGRSGSPVSPNGTSVACSAGPRPPAGTGRVTAPWPSMACTRRAARATRSLTTASPHRPSWRPWAWTRRSGVSRSRTIPPGCASSLGPSGRQPASCQRTRSATARADSSPSCRHNLACSCPSSLITCT